MCEGVVERERRERGFAPPRPRRAHQVPVPITISDEATESHSCEGFGANTFQVVDAPQLTIDSCRQLQGEIAIGSTTDHVVIDELLPFAAVSKPFADDDSQPNRQQVTTGSLQNQPVF